MAIENLTKKTNKELTPEQRKNKAQAKQLRKDDPTYRDVNYDGVPDRDQVDLATLSGDLEWIGQLVEAVPELRDLLVMHTNMGSFDADAGQQGLKNFQNDVLDSTWWKENNQYARAAFATKQTDPAAWAAQIEDSTNAVRETARALGVRVPESELARLAELSITDGWNQPGREYKLQEALQQFIGSTQAEGEAFGSLADYAAQLRNVATLNGLQFDQGYYDSYAKSVASDLMTIDEAEREIRQQAASLFPVYGDRILAGYNARDLASSYIYTMANEFEIDPQSISLNDPYLQKAMGGMDAQGNFAPQSLWDFKQSLRNDPRWLQTDNAQNKIASMTSRVMEMFGLVG